MTEKKSLWGILRDEGGTHQGLAGVSAERGGGSNKSESRGEGKWQKSEDQGGKIGRVIGR